MYIKEKLRRAAAGLLDLLLPQECLGCGVSQTWLCANCCRQLVINQDFSCSVCRRPSLQGETHRACRNKTPLDGLITACRQSALLKDLIHSFKYEHLQELAAPLSGLLAGKMDNSPVLGSLLLNPQTVLLPVPLHRRKQWNRGYNQAQLLAQQLSGGYPAVLSEGVVERRVNTKTQTELPREQRLHNMKNVFRVLQPELLQGKSVVLVDDVVTTGATLMELGRVCRTAGAREIWGLALVRD